MGAINLIATILIYIFGLCVLLGLFYKPWTVLWWMEKQNRFLVIKYYGSAILLAGLVKFITN